MGVLAQSGVVDILAVTDPDETWIRACREMVPAVQVFDSFDDLLAQDLEAIVVATPSALHAAQCLAAFQRGLAVFCQKPLGRNAAEVRGAVEAVRRADRLLGVDLSYRWTRAVALARHAVSTGHIGRVFHAELVFHNAYGPGKAWFYGRELSPETTQKSSSDPRTGIHVRASSSIDLLNAMTIRLSMLPR